MNTSEILSNNMSLAILNMADLKELFLNWQEEMNQKPLTAYSPATDMYRHFLQTRQMFWQTRA